MLNEENSDYDSEESVSVAPSQQISDFNLDKKISMFDLMQFYIELYLDQIDHELKRAFMQA